MVSLILSSFLVQLRGRLRREPRVRPGVQRDALPAARAAAAEGHRVDRRGGRNHFSGRLQRPSQSAVQDLQRAKHLGLLAGW